MNISKDCYDCGESFSLPDHELEDGYVQKKGEVVWLCPECRDSDGEEVDS